MYPAIYTAGLVLNGTQLLAQCHCLRLAATNTAQVIQLTWPWPKETIDYYWVQLFGTLIYRLRYTDAESWSTKYLLNGQRLRFAGAWRSPFGYTRPHFNIPGIVQMHIQLVPDSVLASILLPCNPHHPWEP